MSLQEDITETLFIDAAHLKAQRTASSLLKKGGAPRHIGRTKDGLNSKFHAAVDEVERSLIIYLTAGQTSDHIAAKLIYPSLPEGAKTRKVVHC